MTLRKHHFLTGCLSLVFMTGVGTTLAIAQDAKTEAPPKAEQAKEAPAEFDPFTVPQTKDLYEVLAYVKKIERWQPQFDATRRGDKEYTTEKRNEYAKSRRAMIVAIDLALSLKPDADDTKNLTRSKWMTLRTLSMFGDEAADKAFVSMTNEIVAAGSTGPLYGEAKKMQLLTRMSDFMDKTGKEPVETILADVKTMVDSDELVKEGVSVAMSAASMVEMRGRYDLSKQMYELAQTRLDKILDVRMQKQTKSQVELGLSRLGLIGQVPDVKGKKLDGTDFDVASLKGKVVLIDFWATWCGPCIAEHPNVVKNYEKYKDRGFEVVGISIDDEQEKLQKFVEEHHTAWITLFNHDETTRGFDDPTARKFHVSGIPATYLVDASGKIVHINVRGERLGELLEQMLGK